MIDNLQPQVERSRLGRGVAGVLPKDPSERSNAIPQQDRTDRTKSGTEADAGNQARVAPTGWLGPSLVGVTRHPAQTVT